MLSADRAVLQQQQPSQRRCSISDSLCLGPLSAVCPGLGYVSRGPERTRSPGAALTHGGRNPAGAAGPEAMSAEQNRGFPRCGQLRGHHSQRGRCYQCVRGQVALSTHIILY